MSAGAYATGTVYEDNFGGKWKIKVQPETLTFTVGTNANASASGVAVPNTPSVSVSKGRRSIGINARLVRFTFTTVTPPGYLAGATISLPVMTPAAFAAYSKDVVGKYTLNAVEYDIRVVGRTPETIQ